MTGLVLDIDNVSRRFGRINALDQVSLRVAPGERVALLGHNGAGKTTLFRAILGFIALDAGAITIDGSQPGSIHARQSVSYLPENVAFPKTLSGREVVTLYARIRKVAPSEALDLLERVGLADAADRRTGTYSKGMRQRLGLAIAMIGNPRLVLLDEPTSGLDPLSRQDFYALVNERAASGTSVLLSSHGLGELEAKTDRIAILRSGELVADAPLSDLQQAAALPLRIWVKARPDMVDTVSDQLGGQRINGQALEFFCTPDEKMARIKSISALGEAVMDFEIAQPSLVEIYRHYSQSDVPAIRLRGGGA